MPKKLTLEDIIPHFEKENYLVLSTEYTNAHVKLELKCPNNHYINMSWNHFKNGVRCPLCQGIKRYTYDEVKQYFKDNNCILLSKEYKNNQTLLGYICECGNVSKIRFSDFLAGKRCRLCGNKKLSEQRRHSYTYIYNYFKEYGCELLSTEYINNNQLLTYKCVCGNIGEISFSSFQQGHRCRKCGNIRQAKSNRRSFESVKKIFEVNNCILLETEYLNCDIPLKYICSCGNYAQTSLYNFIRGHRCKKCRYEKISGENNHNWRSDLTEDERILQRSLPENLNWSKDILKQDNYTCHCCGSIGGKLNAHHLDGYNWCVERRFDLTNGVTLCENCHKEFHNMFGYGDNTKEQFDIFLSLKHAEHNGQVVEHREY